MQGVQLKAEPTRGLYINSLYRTVLFVVGLLRVEWMTSLLHSGNAIHSAVVSSAQSHIKKYCLWFK